MVALFVLRLPQIIIILMPEILLVVNFLQQNLLMYLDWSYSRQCIFIHLYVAIYFRVKVSSSYWRIQTRRSTTPMRFFFKTVFISISYFIFSKILLDFLNFTVLT